MRVHLAPLLAILGGAAAAGGCAVPLAEDSPGVENVCDDGTQCPGATCAAVDGVRRCVATSADLAGVVFALEGTSALGARISHVFEKGLSIQGSVEQGVVVSLDLDVPPPASFAAAVGMPGGPIPGCTAADGTVPLKAELRSDAALAGLEQVLTALSEPRIVDGQVATHEVTLAVPRGVYDVHLAPVALPPECGATLPPRFFAAVEVTEDVFLAPEPEEPRRLTGAVVPTADRPLEGFQLELVDRERGLVVSEVVTLGAPSPEGDIPLLGGPDGTDPRGVAYYYTEGLVLRLSDPEGRLVVHWVLDALDREGDGRIDLDLGDLIAGPRLLRAAVVDAQQAPVAAATVTVKSLLLTGDVSQNAQFRVTATSDARGEVEVELVPGTYQVNVTPTVEPGPSLLEDEWIVTEDSLCCGKTFVLGARPLLTGAVRTGGGGRVVAAPVLATPTVRGQTTYFETVFEALDLLPRQATTTTDDSSLFSLQVDPGEYDVGVRPPASTLFPWLVLPALVVGPSEQQPAVPLGDLVLPSPVIVTGTAALEGVVASGAVLRAYLPLLDAEDTSSPTRVVSIGETVVEADGRFVLPLPPTVTLGGVPGAGADPPEG